MKLYHKMHEKALKVKRKRDIERSLKKTSLLTREPTIYDLIKGTLNIKEQAILSIRKSISMSEKKKINSVEKKNYGFTRAIRKNEFIIKTLVSPGPCYNTREEFAKNAVKIHIPHEKRKTLWEPNNIPGPGTYHLPNYREKYEGEAYKEFEIFLNRHKILKSALHKK